MKRWLARQKPSAREGFVLLLTVGLLLITVITTARMAQGSLRFALEAIQAEESIQDRWLRASLQRVVLNRAARQFAAAAEDSTRDRPPTSIDAELRLGQRTLALRLADEDAKINLNQIHEVQGAAEVGTVVRRHAAGRGLTVRLQPSKSATDAPTIPYESWGQVFDLSRGASPRNLMEGTRELTCWGVGTTNRARVPGTQVRDRLEELPDGAGAERGQPRGELNEPPDRLVGRRSSCYSLWVVRDTGQCELMLSEVVQGRRYVTSFLW